MASTGREGYWKDKHLAEETKQKLKILNKGHIPPNKGKKMKDGEFKELREKQSLMMKGNKIWIGRKHSEETISKMKVPKSEAHKQKLKEAWIIRKQKLSMPPNPNSIP